MKSIFYAYLVTVLVITGCSSGKSTFERGNYYEAVITSVNRLRKNGDHKKSVETLRQAYPMAVSFYEDRAKTSLASTERFKWSEVVKSYSFINTMYDEIKRCPGALAVIPNPVNYFSKLQEARQNAAEENYAAGILALQEGNREKAKQAYAYFKIANDYVPGYKEVDDYLQAALAAATVKILVEPIPVHSKAVGVSAEFFNDKVSEFVHGAAISEFVKFYTKAEAQKIKLKPDHIIQLSFDEFTVGQIYKHEKETQLTKDSVVMGTYVSPNTSASQNGENNRSTSVNRTGLAVNGTTVVASTGTQSNAGNPSTTVNNSQTNADHERAAKELAEKRRQEQEQAKKAEAERLRAEQEAAERERLAKAVAAERAAKEADAQANADKIAAEKAEKEKLEKERSERELTEKINAEKEKAEREKIEREKAEKEAADRMMVEKARAEKEKADREASEKEKSEKEKAEKEKSDREKAEKEKTDKKKYTDPTINSDDTLNVTDPVFVCHTPPGNAINARTLKINRSALKAHLAHGDMEGTCETDKKEQKDKPAENHQQKAGDDQKSKPEEKKGKGPGGSARVDHGSSALFTGDHVMLASSENDLESMLRYLEFTLTERDTNKVYGTVKATLYHHTKTTTSKGVVSFRIIDAKTGALLAVEKMPGEYVWKSEWATFNGDERALSTEQLGLTKQKELPPPAAQELFIEFTRPIYDQITSKIKAFYKGY